MKTTVSVTVKLNRILEFDIKKGWFARVILFCFHALNTTSLNLRGTDSYRYRDPLLSEEILEQFR